MARDIWGDNTLEKVYRIRLEIPVSEREPHGFVDIKGPYASKQGAKGQAKRENGDRFWNREPEPDEPRYVVQESTTVWKDTE